MRVASKALPLTFAVFAVSACGSSESSTVAPATPETTTHDLAMVPPVVPLRAVEVPEDLAFWKEFAIDANWFESYPTVRETTKAADFAVIANVRSVVPMEPIRGDAPGGDITVVHLVMEVVTDISGSGLKEFTLQLEGGPLEREQYAAWLDELATQLPTGSAFFALRMSTVAYIINSWSVWVMSEEGLVAPLDPNFDRNRALFHDELRELETYEELTLYLASSTD